jgi:hypothetical protein
LFLGAFFKGLVLFRSLWFGILGCWNLCVLAGFSKIVGAIYDVYLFCSFGFGVCLGSGSCCSSWLVKGLCTDQVGFLCIFILFCVVWFDVISNVYLFYSLALGCAWVLVVVAVLD